MPTKYNILAGFDNYEVIESSNFVTQASPSIDWSVGLPFEHIRSYCSKKGWKILPVLEQSNVTNFDFKGSHYEVVWNGNRIVRLSKDQEEISWRDLPEQLKGLL